MIETGDTLSKGTYRTSGDGEMTLPTGQPMVLYFYPKDDTPGCTTEAIEFTAALPEFAEIGVEIVGVSPDTAQKHDRFISKHALAIELIADEDHALAERCGVWVEKKMYGKTFMGIERSTFLLDGEGKAVEVWRKVKVSGHVEAVLDAARRHFG